jgi:hypothetical protein
MDSVNIVKSIAENSSPELAGEISPEMLASVMSANNQMLKAAIIENGGELMISPEAIYETLVSLEHVVAEPVGNGAIRLSLALKKAVLEKETEMMAL